MARIRLDPWPLHARCPGCGEVTSHGVLRVDADGTRHLRCKACGHEWSRGRARARTAATSEAERRAEGPSAPAREPVACLVCGAEFVPRQRAQVTCSRQCYEAMRRGRGLVALIARTRALDARMQEVRP